MLAWRASRRASSALGRVQLATSSPAAAACMAPKRARAYTAKATGVADTQDVGKSKAATQQPGRATSWYLIKSEPDEFSIDDLKSKPNGTGCWEGVRNAQARNFMQAMRVGDKLLFYHSSCKVPGIAGLASVAREAYPDFTAWDASSKYFDPKSPENSPKWHMVDVKYERHLRRHISLEELKSHKEGALNGMLLFNRPRLSVQPVDTKHVDFILGLEPLGLEKSSDPGCELDQSFDSSAKRCKKR